MSAVILCPCVLPEPWEFHGLWAANRLSQKGRFHLTKPVGAILSFVSAGGHSAYFEGCFLGCWSSNQCPEIKSLVFITTIILVALLKSSLVSTYLKVLISRMFDHSHYFQTQTGSSVYSAVALCLILIDISVANNSFFTIPKHFLILPDQMGLQWKLVSATICC